ncbi:DUF4424 family protein [Acetivibrio cellulolyticus]|uniref:DUF4424 family protein n=1 Tax=Acetivibrio cellulolyticus TaxID=35830 RepID=UPI0001E2EC2C|nr:DUF4424 family protein [Acetivibrio cellulolyticus]
MRAKSILTVLKTIFFMLLFSITTVYADDCSVGRTPDGVYPMEDTDIVMESEDIRVDVEKGFVECNFIFKNTGEEKDVLMGFPAKMENDGDNTSEDNLYLKDFKTFSGGSEISVKTDKGVKPKDLKDSSTPYYSAWYTFSVHFESGEKKNIRNTYNVNFTSYSNGEVHAGYILKTGAFWKDPIGYAKVTFDLGNIEPYRIINIYPYSMRFNGKNTLVWERSDFEPDFDLAVKYHGYFYSEEYFQEMSEDKKEALAEVEAFKKLDKELDKLSQEELLSYYNKYISDRKTVIAKYIMSKMPEGVIPEGGPVIKDLSIEGDENTSNSYRVNGKFEDVNGDFVSASLKVSHIENGQEVVDYNEVYTIGDYLTNFQDEQSFYVDFLPDINYDIDFMVKDSQDNIATKKIKYPSEPENQNDNNPNITNKVNQNEENTIKDPEVTQNNINNKETNSASTPLSGITVVLIIGGCVALLIIILLVYRFLRKKKDMID